MKYNGVICSIDANDFDQDVVDMAAEFAKQFGVPLNVLHVTLFPDPNTAAWPAYVGSPNTIIQDYRRLKAIKPNVHGVEIRYHHLTGIPVRKVIDFVKRNEPRLLVLGTHARRGLNRIFGSVASSILRQVDCPVMVLRQRQNSSPLASAESG